MSEAARPVLRVDGLHRTYRMGESDLHVLRGIDLEVRKGEVLAIMGPSGAGKSTLLHLLGMLDQPTRGRVLYQNIDLASASGSRAASIRNKSFGFVFQFFYLVPELTVLENVAVASMVGTSTFAWPFARWGAYARARRILDRLGMSHRLQSFPTQLSGGERQRVAIARALMNDPEVIFCDEPTGNLDSATASEIHQVLKKLNRELGKTLVIVTHDDRIAEIAHRVVKLVDGKVVDQHEREPLVPPSAASGAEPWAAASGEGAAPNGWTKRVTTGLVLAAVFLGWIAWTWGSSALQALSDGEPPMRLVFLSAALAGIASLGCLAARDTGRRLGVLVSLISAAGFGVPLVAEAARTAAETWVLSVPVQLRFLLALSWLLLAATAAIARGRERAQVWVGFGTAVAFGTLVGAGLWGRSLLQQRVGIDQQWVTLLCVVAGATFAECIFAFVLSGSRGWYASAVLLPFLAVTVLASAGYLFLRTGSHPALVDAATALGGLLFVGLLGSPALRKRLRA
ncbi:MAG: ABC transporter ATP-binding protein [Planctomycetota bacterium]